MLVHLTLLYGALAFARGWGEEFTFGTFPRHFVWGVASSTPGRIYTNWDNDTSDQMSYAEVDNNIRAAKFLGVSHYHFALNWSRLFTAREGQNSPNDNPGLKYYNHVINATLAAGMTPVVTLLAGELPIPIQEDGGWLNSSTVRHFRDYAMCCFKEFGDRVKFWVTMQDPSSMIKCWHSVKGIEENDPAIQAEVQVNVMTSHNEVYKLYDTDFRATRGGQIGIILSTNWYKTREPDMIDDVMADSASFPNHMGDVLTQLMHNRTTDFVGVAYPTTFLSQPLREHEQSLHAWSRTALTEMAPGNLRKLLNWLKGSVQGLPIYVVVSIARTDGGATGDLQRVACYRDHINEILKAINIDDCLDVKGFFFTSPMDTHDGSENRIGGTGSRGSLPKASELYIQQVVKDNGFTEGFNIMGGMATGRVANENSTLFDQFPEGFRWGASTSAYQIEGAWNEDGRGATFLDVIAHIHKGAIIDNSTGNVACDSYHKYMEDIRILQDTKVDTYHFSISWGRIFPYGTNHTVNQLGVAYYKKVIDGLLAAGIEPIATIYKYDMPVDLLKIGGWTNQSTIEHFKAYARVCFQEFGDKV
ncbi:lactase-phlorizin hydrolase-like isoform X2 [Mizuhopecten yessoensis]|uniref:Lactase-phlorizin hydrolase n=1 Tax=Mizuhopecten yessoensis TaxID=6573 RepID=A0A210QWH7_MIZYE|nr:lactase-phlorizin hydrolase-like isoform X1 [Mizuhopecten yessoensis]XP_021347916.1 lactase-phlorizin hydrolase-like isoform X2 [Mizuhopecten yessoensis]OWF53073.1 Lactase-phlorizin hydrolase [Mizuhopecten yessoensis]